MDVTSSNTVEVSAADPFCEYAVILTMVARPNLKLKKIMEEVKVQFATIGADELKGVRLRPRKSTGKPAMGAGKGALGKKPPQTGQGRQQQKKT